MRIALIRGPSLNLYEMQNEVPLLTHHELTAFATSYAPEWNRDRLPQLPVEHCFWPDLWFAKTPRLRWLFNGICSRVLGFSYYMRGLEKKLAAYSILHTLETHNTYSFQAARAARRYGKKLVVTVWETIPRTGERHPLRRRRKRFVCEQADAFIAVTMRTKNMLETEGIPSKKIHVIPMGIDQTHFKPEAADPALRSSWGVRSGEFVWLCVARLVEEKGIADILNALAQTENCHLILVGRGPKQNVFQALAHQLNIQDRVTFAGGYRYEQMPRVYASADALVLASRTTDWWEEQFGYCLVEAMSCGKPIVAANTGAIAEVVGDAALLIPEKNPQALAQVMSRLQRDKSLQNQLADAGLSRARERYSHHFIAAKLEKLYASLAGNG